MTPVELDHVPREGAAVSTELRRRHRLLLDALPGSTVVVFDRALRVLLVGGPDQSDSANEPVPAPARRLDAMFGGDASVPAEAARETLATGRPVDLIHDRGENPPALRIRISALREDGNITAGLAVVDKTTGQVDTTRRVDGNWRALFEDSTIGMCLMDRGPGGTVIAANAVFCTLLQVDSAQMVGAPRRAVIPGVREAALDPAQAAFLDGDSEQLEVTWSQADGTHRHVMLTATTIPGPTGSRTLVHAADITVARETDRELAEALSFQTAVLAATPDVIVVRDAASRRALWASRALEEMLGYDLEDLQRVQEAGPAVIVHSDDLDAYVGALDEVIAATDDRVLDVDARVLDASGRWRTLQMRLTPFTRNPAGYVTQVLSISREVTAHREALAELKRSNEELTQFAYVASHDLSEPLRVIAGHVDLLARRYAGELDDTAQEWINFAVDGCRRMRDLIDDVLLYSRAGREHHPEVVSLAVPVQAAISDLSLTIAETSSEITVQGELPEVRGDVTGLSALFRNLISNAIRYRRPDHGAHVVMSALRTGQNWQVRIADDGIGIPEHQRERVFRIFQRLHGREIPGTGIGLAICQKIVERISGTISIETTTGGGTTFVVEIPALTWH